MRRKTSTGGSVFGLADNVYVMTVVNKPDATDDATLLRRYVVDHAQDAMDSLVDRYSELVYGVCRRRTGHRELAEDAAQAVFVLLCRQAPRLLTHPTLAGWLYSAADKVARDAVRGERRRAICERRAGGGAERSDELSESLAIHLEEAMVGLSMADRHVIVLRFLLGYSLIEIGKTLKITEDAARMRVQRALGKLRRELSKFGVAASMESLPGAFPKTSTPPELYRSLKAILRPLPLAPKGVLLIMTIITAFTASTLAVLVGHATSHASPTTTAPRPIRTPPPVASMQTVSGSPDLSKPAELNGDKALNLIVQSLVGKWSFERIFTGFGQPPTHEYPGKTNIVFDSSKQTLAIQVLEGTDASADSLTWEINPKAGTMNLGRDFEDPKADTAFHFVSGAIKKGTATIHLKLQVTDADKNSSAGQFVAKITRSHVDCDLHIVTSAHGGQPTKGEMRFIFTRSNTP